MEKLYYENQYIKEFTAEVINAIEKNNEFHVELDKTYFYPESGGQPSDIGYIESIPVIYVYENEGAIYHVLEKKLLKIHRVKCSIDWERRFDHMQQHLGQHILSASFSQLYNATTIGFHLSKDYCTIDLDKSLDNEQLGMGEKMANKIIVDNITVETLFPTNSELKKLPLKKKILKSDEQIRIVKIAEIDINPCCGTHPRSTIEVQMIKITKCEKYKSGIRIEFLCGNRAVNDYFKRFELTSKLSNILSCNTNDILEGIQKINVDLNKTVIENKSLKSQVVDYEVQNMLSNCEILNGIRVLKSIYNNIDLKQVNLLATKLITFPNVIVLFGVKCEDKANLLFMCSKDMKVISMNSLLKDAITLIDGKGGGSDFSAQGGGKNNNNLGSALEYAFTKVKESIK